MHFLDVLTHSAARHQVRRNHQPQRLNANSRSVGDDEIAKTEERLIFLPHRNVEKCVRSDDEINSIALAVIAVAKIPHRIDRIVQLRPAEIFACLCDRRNKVRMLRACQRYHRESMRKRRQVLLQFMRRTAGRNEMNLIKIESPVSGPGNSEMPVVDRIERSAKKRDAAWMMFRGGAMRLRGRQ